MAKRQLKPWHYQVTTALAIVTLFFVIAYFVQTFQTFFLTEHDPVLVAVERIKEKSREAGLAKEAAQNGAEVRNQTADPEQTGKD